MTVLSSPVAHARATTGHAHVPGVAGATAATLLLGAAAIHAVVTPPHLQEWLPAGLFFATLTVLQTVLAVLLLGDVTVPRILVTLWSTVGVLLLYVWSRTTGLPFAPVDAHEHAGGSHVGHAVGGIGNGVPNLPGTPAPSSVEAVGTPDLIASGAEVVLVILLAAMLPRRMRTATTTTLLVLGAALFTWRALGSPA